MIPDYQTLMLPLLKYISDEEIHNTQEAINYLGKEFRLNDEELNEWLPSKKQKIFDNRVHWAKAYLKMAEAIENISKGKFKITDRGKTILKANPLHVDVKFLMNLFPDFYEKINSLRQKKKDNKHETVTNEITEEVKITPEEQLEIGYRSIRNALQDEILTKLKSVHYSFFEIIVLELLTRMGYGGPFSDATKVVGKKGDEGIDGLIKEDTLGLDTIYVQAKRWEGVVGRPELHKFVGALAGQGAKKGIFITTSSFTKEAEQYTPKNETKIVLIDGERLAQYMIDYNLGVSIQNIYEIKKIDSDYFEED